MQASLVTPLRQPQALDGRARPGRAAMRVACRAEGRQAGAQEAAVNRRQLASTALLALGVLAAGQAQAAFSPTKADGKQKASKERAAKLKERVAKAKETKGYIQ